MPTNADAIRAIRALSDIIEETARESMPMGAPSGIIYAALMSHGVSLEVYQQILAAMQAAGRITVAGDLIKVAA